MSEQSIGRTTIVWKRSNPLLKVVLAVLIVFSIAAMAALGWAGSNLSRRNRELTEQASKLELENNALENKIDSLGTESSIRQIAEEELGMVESNTILIQPEAIVK